MEPRDPAPAVDHGHRRSAFLLLLAVPLLNLRLGFADESNFADDTTTKQAYDLVVEGFGEGWNGQIYLVASVDSSEQAIALNAVNSAVAGDDDVESIRGPQRNDAENPTAVRWIVTPAGGPQDESTSQLVNRLRNDLLPPVEDTVGTEVLVSGQVAGNIDMSAYMGDACRSSSSACLRCRSCC